MDQIRVLLRRYITAAWRYRWATIACAWILSAAGWVGTTFIPNQYEANARLYVDADAVLTPMLQGIAIDTGNNRQLDILQRTLLSRPNLEKLISNTDLDLGITGPADLERMVQTLGSEIRISPQTANIFTISYRNPSPKLAFDVVQSVLTTFIENKSGNNRAEMQNAQVFLDQQLAGYERRLREAEKRRADFKTKYIDLLPSDATGVSHFEQAQEGVRQLQGQLQDQIQRRDMLKAELSSTPAMLVTETDPNGRPLSAGLTADQAKLKAAEDQLTEMRLKYTDNHPDVVAQRKLIESLRGSAARSVADATDARKAADATGKPGDPVGRSRSQPNPVYEQLKVRLVDAEATQASLQRQLEDATRERDRLQEVARGAPGLQAEFTNLNRDYDVIRRNYEELLTRREAMKIGSAADTQADKIKIQIVDPPQVPQNPVAPKRALLITGVLLGALGAGFGLALLLAQFDQSFHTLDELRDLGLPVAGSISLIAVTSRIGRMASAIGFSSALALLCAVYAGLILRLLRSTGHA
jgi:polysaccharide chain length determinant protein (PEP-CTERM system associated)